MRGHDRENSVHTAFRLQVSHISICSNLTQITLQPLKYKTLKGIYLMRYFLVWTKLSQRNHYQEKQGESILLSYRQEVWLPLCFLIYFCLFVLFLHFWMRSGVSPGEIKVSYLQWPKATVQQLGHDKGRAITHCTVFKSQYSSLSYEWGTVIVLILLSQWIMTVGGRSIGRGCFISLKAILYFTVKNINYLFSSICRLL